MVEYVADGKVIAREMRYAAENQHMERDGPKETASDWDSLSERIRKQKRQQKSLLQQQKGGTEEEFFSEIHFTFHPSLVFQKL